MENPAKDTEIPNTSNVLASEKPSHNMDVEEINSELKNLSMDEQIPSAAGGSDPSTSTKRDDNTKSSSTTESAKQSKQERKKKNQTEYKGLCVASFYYLYSSESARTFLNQHLPTKNVRFIQGTKVKGTQRYRDCGECFEATLDLSDGCSLQTLETVLSKAWSDFVSENEPCGWFEIRPKDQRVYYIHNQSASEMKLNDVHVTGGALTSPSNFVQHWEIRNSLRPAVTFEHDKELMTIATEPVLFGASQLVIEMSYNSLIESIIVSSERNTYKFYIGTKQRPKLYTKRKISEQKIEERRVTSFDNVSRTTFGMSSTICFAIQDTQSAQFQKDMSVWQIISRLKRSGFSIEYSNVEHGLQIPNPRLKEVAFSDFETQYAWRSLLSHGYKITDSMDEEDITDLQSVASCISPDAFFEMTNGVEDKMFFDFKDSFNNSRAKVEKKAKINEKEDLPPHFALIRRMVITPTTKILLQKEPIVQNRVLRQYDNDYFIRVVLRDEDFERLSATLPENLNQIIDRFKEILNNGFTIGDRHYAFLACSNSQLREHGVWFFSSYNGITADRIRSEQGNLSNERCVASYVSRLALCFSSSRDTVDVDVDEGSVLYIDDIEKGEYCFTDGIGQISLRLANRVAAELEMEHTPSAFQIRFGGCKGVVSQDPKLGDSDLITIRPSMNKFESPSKRLEILQVTHPGQLFLNRQAITLMSGLGVPDQEFLSLQESMLMNMADMMLYEDKAMQSLSSVSIGIKYKKLQKQGFILTQEPFFRSILMILYKSKLSELLTRSRIEIPPENGRSMMGTVDETGMLSYGEVYIAYSKEPHLQQRNVIVHTGNVVVTKNPCFHPGDLRKFNAVDVPELSHMVDCIVFPNNGSRPHPNEMTGSDLDGDMYFVCWDPKLIPTIPNEKAMHFPKAVKLKLPRPITSNDVVEYIGDYIKLDQLGIIANAHVVHADMKGIYSPECLQLAEMHSEAVDFPKTGKAPTMQRELRVEKYPDFMTKSDKPTYTSGKILGKLHRQCKALERAQKRYLSSNIALPNVTVDACLKYPGYEIYIEEAHVSKCIYEEKVTQMMVLYGIENESEIVTGVIQKVRRKRGSLKNEKFEIGQIVRAKMSVIRERTRAEFFREFNGEDEAMSDTEIRTNVLAKASAWYIASYDSASQSHEKVPLLSFPWVISDILAELKASRNPSAQSKKGTGLSEIQRNKMSLQQIGYSLVRHYDQTIQERVESSRSCWEIATYAVQRIKSVAGETLDVFPTGLFLSGLLGINENVIDLTVLHKNRRHLYSANEFVQLLNFIPEFKLHQIGTNPLIEWTEANVFILINQSPEAVRRCRFVCQFVKENFQLMPVLHFLLDWFRSTGIVGKNKNNNIFNELEFVLIAIDILLSTSSKKDLVCRINKTIVDSQQQTPDFDLCYPNPENLSDFNVCCEIAENTLNILKQFNVFVKESFTTKESCLKFSDPSSSAKYGGIILRMDKGKVRRITDELLYTYQEIAQTKSVDTFFGEVVLQDGHFVQTLPLDIWGSIMFAEAYSARRLSEVTGAEVHIRRTHFRDVAGLILEAWGTNEQLWQVMKSLQDLAEKSTLVINTMSREKTFIKGAFHSVFEGCTSELNTVRLQPYCGPAQPDHDNKDKYIPSLHSTQNESDNMETDFDIFKAVFIKQMGVIRRDFEPTYHGDIRLGLAFGTYYVINSEFSEVTVQEFTNRTNEKPDTRLYVGGGRGRWRGRGRGRRNQRSNYSTIVPVQQRMMRSSFIPIDFEERKLASFLLNRHFESDKEDEKYHVSIKFGSPDYGKQHTGTAILDNNMDFIELRLSDIKWLAIDIVRPSHKDVRCKIQSRRMVHIDTVKEIDDIKVLLNPETKLLIKYQQNELYANSNFRDKVTFVRKKCVTKYRYAGPLIDDSLWQNMRIELAKVTEYSRPDVLSGRFDSIVTRNEVTVFPKFTSLENDEEWEPFVENIWRLITQLGEILE